jgi:hypothetical protein
MMDTVSEDVKRRAPRHNLASGAVASEAALSSDPPRGCVTGGRSPENPATTLASR